MYNIFLIKYMTHYVLLPASI